jgi:hypothetical protein
VGRVSATVTRGLGTYEVRDATGLWWATYRIGHDGDAAECAGLAHTLRRGLDRDRARRPVALDGIPVRRVNRRGLL